MNFRNLIFACVLFSQISTYLCKPASKRGRIRLLNDGEQKIEKRITFFNVGASAPSSSGTSSCFPATASVNLENGITVAMSELRIGDRVQAVSPDGLITYSEVSTFLTKIHDGLGRYVSITTSGNKTISSTEGHLIYARKPSSGTFYPIYSDQISVGDEVMVLESSELVKEMVVNVSSSIMQGAFGPLTMEGTIIVDGVLTSCYAVYNKDVAHVALTPIRLLPKFSEWIFGNDVDAQAFVEIAKTFGNWALPYLQFSSLK